MADFVIMPIEDYRRACDAVRTKTGGTEDITSGELEAQILSIETGVQLPVLVSPGAAAQLLEGYQLIDQDGNIVDGAMPESETSIDDISVLDSGYVQVWVKTTMGYNAGRLFASGIQLAQGGGQTITPTKMAQTAVPKGVYTIAPVMVAAIPDEYQDVSGVTAAPADVLRGKKIQTVVGELEGTMPNNGKTSGTLDGLNTTSVSVPEGYTEGGEITFDDTALAARIDAI